MERFEITKLATCKRCGSTAVTWLRSYRTGKPYLAQVDIRDNTTARNDFHKCQTETAKPAAPTAFEFSEPMAARAFFESRGFEVIDLEEITPEEQSNFERAKAVALLNRSLALPAAPPTPPVSRPQLPTPPSSPTEPRNIPCPKCAIPNRVTYSELIRGKACHRCCAD